MQKVEPALAISHAHFTHNSRLFIPLHAISRHPWSQMKNNSFKDVDNFIQGAVKLRH